MNRYIEVTDPIRDGEMFFVSYIKPHKAVSRDTLARWIVETLKQSGVDIKSFSSHSTRSAATSKMKCTGVPLEDILKCGGWSNARTFAKFYHKPIENADAAKSMLDCLPKNPHKGKSSEPV